MPQPGIIDINDTIRVWTDIVIDKFPDHEAQGDPDEAIWQSDTYSMINTMTETFDQRYESKLEARTVSNLRTVRYRGVQNDRNMRNYYKRQALPGRWRNEHKTWKPD